MQQNNIIPLDQFQGNVALDVSGGLLAAGGGGAVPEGVYTATLTNVGIMPGRNGKSPSLTLTLSGIGGRDTYDYLNLPIVGPNGEKPENADIYARALAQAASAFGQQVEAKDLGVFPVSALGQWFQIGAQAKVYYIPSALSENKGADGKRIVLGKQEVTYLTAEEVAKIEAGELQITRRMTVKPDPTVQTSGANLGSPAGGQGAPTLGGGGSAPTLGGGAPANNGAAPTLGGGMQSPSPSGAPTLASQIGNA